MKDKEQGTLWSYSQKHSNVGNIFTEREGKSKIRTYLFKMNTCEAEEIRHEKQKPLIPEKPSFAGIVCSK